MRVRRRRRRLLDRRIQTRPCKVRYSYAPRESAVVANSKGQNEKNKKKQKREKEKTESSTVARSTISRDFAAGEKCTHTQLSKFEVRDEANFSRTRETPRHFRDGVLRVCGKHCDNEMCEMLKFSGTFSLPSPRRSACVIPSTRFSQSKSRGFCKFRKRDKCHREYWRFHRMFNSKFHIHLWKGVYLSRGRWRVTEIFLATLILSVHFYFSRSFPRLVLTVTEKLQSYLINCSTSLISFVHPPWDAITRAIFISEGFNARSIVSNLQPETCNNISPFVGMIIENYGVRSVKFDLSIATRSYLRIRFSIQTHAKGIQTLMIF